MPLDPQAQLVLDQMKAAGVPPVTGGTPEDARAMMAGIRAMVADGPAEASVRDFPIPVDGGEITLREITPPGEPIATVVWFHGGGFVIDGNEVYTPQCRVLAVASEARVVMVDCRVAPEHPYPVPVQDADAAVDWIARNYEGPLVIGGDSAGGDLAAVATRHARDSGLDVVLQVLLYPVTDGGEDTDSYRERATGYIIGAEDMSWFWGHYVPEREKRDHPDVSPLRSNDLIGLAPAYIAVAEYDPLRDEGIAYAERLREAGVPVRLEHYEDQMHGFALMVGVLDVAERSLQEASAAIRDAVAATAGK